MIRKISDWENFYTFEICHCDSHALANNEPREYSHVQEITTEMGILQESPLLGTVVECLECLEMMFVKRIEIA